MKNKIKTCDTCKYFAPDQDGWGSCVKRPRGKNLYFIVCDFFPACEMYHSIIRKEHWTDEVKEFSDKVKDRMRTEVG